MPSTLSMFFSYGFRTFFVTAALFAGLSILAWVAQFGGLINSFGTLDAITWHAHEMMFGYLAAVLAGFTLTAVANWTGRPPVSGPPLILLFTIWLASRIAMALALFDVIPLGPATLIDVTFIPVFAFLFGREVIAGGNKRNLVVVGAVSAFGLANLLFCLNALDIYENDLWSRLGLGVAALLIALIGGRVAPAFTGNWLKSQGQQAVMPEMGGVDKAALLLTALSVLSWVIFPYHLLTAFVLMTAGVALLVRLSRWHGLKTMREPLIFFLHVGYGFLAISLVAIGTSIWQPNIVAISTGLHLLTAGTIGLMTFVVMTRALLGHTGRPLVTSPAVATALLLIAGGALLRAGAPWVPTLYIPLVSLSGIIWSGGFLIFAVHFAPMIVRPR